ncbi:MAG: hypothetical protein KC442_01255 [Thermomicrobiales bacterium]|nr:hypothetical protein [Thermomicrobiales bacterium]
METSTQRASYLAPFSPVFDVPVGSNERAPGQCEDAERRVANHPALALHRHW